MVRVIDKQHFQTVARQVISLGLFSKFKIDLNRLCDLGRHGCDLRIHSDFAPLSFTFCLFNREGRFIYNGGFIYSGPDQPLDGSFPALCVSLDNEHRVGWSIHT